MSDGELQKEFTEGENGRYLSSLFNFLSRNWILTDGTLDYSNLTATRELDEFEVHFEGHGEQVSLNFVFYSRPLNKLK